MGLFSPIPLLSSLIHKPGFLLSSVSCGLEWRRDLPLGVPADLPRGRAPRALEELRAPLPAFAPCPVSLVTLASAPFSGRCQRARLPASVELSRPRLRLPDLPT